jgi:hypothetical protein
LLMDHLVDRCGAARAKLLCLLFVPNRWDPIIDVRNSLGRVG